MSGNIYNFEYLAVNTNNTSQSCQDTTNTPKKKTCN